MKFTVTMKDPDTLHDAIDEALDENMPLELSADEWERVKEIRHDDTMNVANKWFSYGEYITVEIDTDAGTCVVLPAN